MHGKVLARPRRSKKIETPESSSHYFLLIGLLCFWKCCLRLQKSADIQNDLESMSSAIKKRIWSQIWDPAWQFTRFERASKTSFARATPTNASRSFSWSRPRLQSQSPKRTHVKKSFASCGFLFLDISPTATTASSTITSCTTAAEKTLYTSSTSHRPSICSLARQAWRREIHSSSGRRQSGNGRRNKSSTSTGQSGLRKPPNESPASKIAPDTKNSDPPTPQPPPSNYLHLPHLPKMPHRPTKEELLAAATGFWSRLKVRFKWFSIRSVRPWNIDDWSAFVSWFVLGNIVWILVGTTTFFSLVIFSINTVVAQGKLATSNFTDFGLLTTFQKHWRDGLVII